MGRGRRESGWRWWLWTKARQGQCFSLFLMTPIHGASFHLCLVILVVSSFLLMLGILRTQIGDASFQRASVVIYAGCRCLLLLWAHAASFAYPLELCQVSASALHLARQGLSSIWWGSPFPPLDSPFVYVLCLGLNIQLTNFPPSL